MRKLTICLVSIVLCSACMQTETKQTFEEPPRKVRVVSSTELEYKIPVRATGMLGSSSEMKLSFKTGGIVEKITAREGVSVKKGTELARLDLAEIKAQVNQAWIGQEKARRDLDRAKNLYEDSVATLEQYQDAKSAYDLAISRRRIADFNLQHSSIVAPSNGKVQKVLVENNELIAPGYPAIFFASTESEWVVRASITDKDIVKLKIGDTARVVMDAFPGTEFPGEVTELASVADPVTGTYEVEVMLQGRHPQFRTGFISRVDILPMKSIRSLVVPIETLINANDHNAELFIYEEGKAVKRNVRIGRVLDESVVIHDGLKSGELVISDGSHYVRDGDEVELVEDML